METQLIADIEQEMLTHLDNHQMEQLHKVLSHYLRGVTPAPVIQETGSGNGTLLANFIAAKRVEGCSCKSLRYYESTLNNMLTAMDKPVKHITTDDVKPPNSVPDQMRVSGLLWCPELRPPAKAPGTGMDGTKRSVVPSIPEQRAANTWGGKPPNALCGRRSLYFLCHSVTISRASFNV
jgi:hypothetical protein